MITIGVTNGVKVTGAAGALVGEASGVTVVATGKKMIATVTMKMTGDKTPGPQLGSGIRMQSSMVEPRRDENNFAESIDETTNEFPRQMAELTDGQGPTARTDNELPRRMGERIVDVDAIS